MFWSVTVLGGAAPLLWHTWSASEFGGRAAQFTGIVAWTILMVAVDERLSSKGRLAASRQLRAGAAVVLVVQGVAALLLPREFLFVLYTIPVLTAATLIPDKATDFYGFLVLTMLCGAQVACMCAALGGLISRLTSRHR
jgi:hypothetical protein